MDSSEKCVYQALRSLGYSDIIYEPDGNVPPDFLVNGMIAVEVRRLNQAFDDGSGPRGLEEVAIPFIDNAASVLKHFGPPIDGRTWFVIFDFARPLEPWKVLKNKMVNALECFLSEGDGERRQIEIQISSTVSALLIKASEQHTQSFILGGYSDDQAGGWVLAEVELNLRRCIEEKTKKVAPYRKKYPRWWLVFDDQIGYGLNSNDQERFRDQVSVSHDFDRVLLVNHMDPTKTFDITK